MYKNTLFCLALVGVALQLAVALDLVEMNDANKNELNLSLSKALGGVQEAYQNGYQFKSVKDIRKFLDQCEYVSHVISTSEDSEFKGLARKIKAIMADPSVAGPCSVTSAELVAEFDELDTGFSAAKHDYLSTNVLYRLKSLNEMAKANENLKTVVQSLIDSRAKALSDALITSATGDMALFLGEENAKNGLFDMDTTYKSLCDVSLIEPICKLVRRSPNKVEAIAQDFADFSKLVAAKDQDKLAQHIKASGVSMDVVSANCNKMMGKKVNAFKPVQLVREYVLAGLMDKELNLQKFSGSEFSSYVELYDLCQLVVHQPLVY